MYDPVQLRSFLAVAQALSFTRAAARLELRQSTVSQHVRRLEAAVGRPLFARDTHSVALTVDGEAMVTFARDILAAGDRARRHFAAAPVRGRVRLGVSDDLVATHLPRVLRDLRHRHPLVELAVTVDLSGTLHDRFDARELDMVFAKRPPGESPGWQAPVRGAQRRGRSAPASRGAQRAQPSQPRGELLWRDRLVWLAAPGHRLAQDEPVPLVAYPPPSISRGQALAALTAAGRAWQITCTSTSLGGLVAAAQAGLGVLAHSAALVPPGLVPAPAGHRLPALGEVEFILLHREGAPRDLLAALTDAILAVATRPA